MQSLRTRCLPILIVTSVAMLCGTALQWGNAPTASASMFQPAAEPEEVKPDSPLLRKLTEREIQRIRFLELRGIRQGNDAKPEPITVKLDSKLVEEFLTLMEGKPNYTGSLARGEFRKLTAAQKVHFIAAERGPEFADRIHITSDPEVFVEFRKKVMPLILRGCATTGCHGPADSETSRFHLFKDPKKAADTTYANFIVLNDVQVDGVSILNRSQPENSLLLSYMLPTKDVKPEMRHPGANEIKPLFQTRNGPDYKRIEKWIGSLKHPMEDYGVHLLKPGPSSQPADEPPKPAPKLPTP
ncbi:MAG: hypothetical protein HZA51_12765 [Planctomycetes bacterium]|nr:hypothetical protein [Planctomycetota bacterium]